MTLGLGDIDFGYICAGCHSFIQYSQCHDCEGFDEGSAESYPKIFETEDEMTLIDLGYGFSTASNGWTCGVCGAFTQNTEFHVCSGSPQYAPYPDPWNTYPTNPSIFVDPNKEINDKLDEILELLKRLT